MPRVAYKPPGPTHENVTPPSSTGDPGSIGTGFPTMNKHNQAPSSMIATRSGSPFVQDDEMQPVVTEDLGDGNTADEEIRSSPEDLSVLHRQHTPEHQGKDLSYPRPSDDDDEVSEEAAQCSSPRHRTTLCLGHNAGEERQEAHFTSKTSSAIRPTQQGHSSANRRIQRQPKTHRPYPLRPESSKSKENRERGYRN